MKKSEHMLSVLITICIAVVFAAGAAVFALNYNSLFSVKDYAEEPSVSASETEGNRITLNMNMSNISDSMSDSELEEMNVYDFPIGHSKYFIYVEKGAHTLSVFTKDDYGLYTKRVATWSTATGKTASLTPTGIFTIGEKEEWHDWSGSAYSPYASTYYVTDNYYGGLFIHGPIYGSKKFSDVLGDSVSKIGTNCSSGCLRTEVEAAYFVYKLCPEGTQVKIVEGSPFGFTPDRKVQLINQLSEPGLDGFSANAISPESIEFADESHTMLVGEEYQPEVLTVPDYAGNISGTWSTNNPSIVKVSGGTIWAVGTGSAVVSLTTAEGGLTTSMLINVNVSNVDTSGDPPDVSGKTTVNNDNITEDYQPISEKLIRLKIDGKEYAINQSVDPLLKMLGDGYVRTRAQSCAYEGYDKTFNYYYNRKNGICSVFTVPMLAGGEDAICEISIKYYMDKSVESAKGIKLGDDRRIVEAEYGTFYTEESVDATETEDACVRMIYWAGEPNQPGVPYLYFIIDPKSDKVIGMGIFSARNIG